MFVFRMNRKVCTITFARRRYAGPNQQLKSAPEFTVPISVAFHALSPNATGLERGSVQSTSRSTLNSSAASGVFQQVSFAKLLRLVPPRRDTAALRGQCKECSR